MCSSRTPEAWNIHTVVVMFQHELFVHSIVVLPRLARHCDLFTYYLENRRMVSYLLNSIFKLKEQTICNVYSIIPEAWNMQACKCFTGLWHTRDDTADMEEYSRVFWQQGCHSRLFCSRNRFLVMI